VGDSFGVGFNGFLLVEKKNPIFRSKSTSYRYTNRQPYIFDSNFNSGRMNGNTTSPPTPRASTPRMIPEMGRESCKTP
jgi:hypothetical protein